MKQIEWTDVDVNGTSLRGYLATGWSFEELVARLVALSGQDPTLHTTDGYKVSVEFTGRFDGQVFTLYDYKEDNEIHIGGHPSLDTVRLGEALVQALTTVVPSPYEARYHYEGSGRRTHGWSAAGRAL